MLRLKVYGIAFCVVSLAGSLAIVSSALAFVLPSREAEKFSELYILDPGHMTVDYPFSVRAEETRLVHLGVSNYMGSSAYYDVVVKLRNQSEPLSNVTAGTPSPLPSLYEYRVFLQPGERWEAPLVFSFSGVSFSEELSLVGNFVVNDVLFTVGKSASWDEENKGYYYQVFIELWIYDTESGGFQYHNRFVGIWLKLTRT